MVYEARAGQTFLLGASTWRIEEITRDRVLVSPAPGLPGAVPFWKGEGVGRPYELGEKVGAASRELSALGDEAALDRLRTEFLLDERAARNLLAFLRDQAAATGAVPSDRTVVIERFRDEIGDWRVCILTPFGGRVHAPWAMAISSRLREGLGIDAQSIWSDDGIAIHFPDADGPPPVADLMVDPAEVEDLVVAELGETALFGARFRENAARSLLIPRRRPGQRTPLWQQRLKAQSLLQVARRYGSFPIVLETYRECLQDVFDLPALRTVLAGIQTRRLDLVEVETGSASPMSSSLLFDYVATYMYEDDTPPAERRAQALSLDRDLLRELLGSEELRDLLDADAVGEVERQLLGSPRTPDELHDQLRIRGDRRAGEYDPALSGPLLDERRALLVRVAGEERLVAAEDAGRYRDALGVMPPGGLPEAFLGGGFDSLRQIVLRFGKGRGPFTTRMRHRSGTAASSGRFSRSSNARNCSFAASSDPAAPSGSGATPTCSAGCGGPPSPRFYVRSSRSSRRRSPASCPPGTESIARPRCVKHSCRSRRSRSRLLSGKPSSCPAACPSTGPSSSIRCARAGRWSGSEQASIVSRCTSVKTPRRSGRSQAPRVRRARSTTGSVGHSRVERSSGLILLEETSVSPDEALPALWDLVWAGEVTNDAWTPLRAGRRHGVPKPERRPRRFSRSRGTGATATQGRWSLTGRLFAGAPERRALAELLLERQGIVTRDGVRAEGIPGGYGAVYGELRALETLGLCRRGYFVEGLGGAQFALGGAVERLRELREPEEVPPPFVVAAADPAQPYGAALPWPKRAGARAARVAGAHVVLIGGEAVLYVERGGRSLVPLREPDESWLRPAFEALVAYVRGGGAEKRRLAVERFDGQPVTESEVLPLLVEAGFLAGPRRAVLRP